jgi:hypothetical protein
MQEQTEKDDARPPAQRRKVILFGCAALFLSFICLAGVATIVGLYPIVRSETTLADGETITEPDQSAVEADAHTATPQEDVAGETADERRTEPATPAETVDTPLPTTTPAPATTPTAPPQGFSRSNPFPATGVANVPNWDVEVLDVVRGDEAWSRIQSANQFNEPPPEGMEYLLAQVRVTSTYGDEQTHHIGGSDFMVTGERNVCYSPASVASPQQELDAELASGGRATGWLPFLISAGESDVMLVLDERANFDDAGVRYIALQAGAAVGLDPALARVEALDTGRSRQSPVAPGETAINENWEVTVLDVIRGAGAWSRIQSANQFNEPPPEGMEYVLMYVQVRNVSTVDRSRRLIESAFNPTGSANVLHKLPIVVSPRPAFNACLYPGGRAEGWVSMQVHSGETDLMARFDPPFESFDEEQIRFLALEEGASLHVPAELADVPPNDLGTARSDPAPLGETVITEDWEITVQEVVRGDQAWTMAQEANQFNDPPQEGMEYVAVRLHVRSIATADKTDDVTAFSFNTLGDQNVQYDVPSAVEPEPVLNASLYPGGQYEGWALYQAARGETNLLLVFDAGFSGAERYLSLEP